MASDKRVGEPPRKKPKGGAAPKSSEPSSDIAAVSAAVATPARERQASALPNLAKATSAGSSRGPAFLRLSEECRPSAAVKGLVYLDKAELTFGRLPTCDVVLDSTRFPQMISRVHGKLHRQADDASASAAAAAQPAAASWTLVNKSMNGILVNDEPITGDAGRVLQSGDVITFGRKVVPPEFEFILEDPHKPPEEPPEPARDVLGEQLHRIAELQRELAEEREQRIEKSQQQSDKRSDLNVSVLQSELQCSICQDWLVQAATIQCSHSFCWACVESWLQLKKFECPVCRKGVTHEPHPNIILDNLVQKSVDRLAEGDKTEFEDRKAAAAAAAKKAKKLHTDLEKSVNDAIQKGKHFFKIDATWSRKERETFQRGVKDYTGETRETYCKLTAMTVQWIHSADSTKLNRALHNLQLQRWVDKTEAEIRQRLLMFLRYG